MSVCTAVNLKKNELYILSNTMLVMIQSSTWHTEEQVDEEGGDSW